MDENAERERERREEGGRERLACGVLGLYNV